MENIEKIKQAKWHPKAVMSLYLEQAKSNFDKFLEIMNITDSKNITDIKFEELSERFIPAFANYQGNKTELLKSAKKALDGFRNFFSHNYHTPECFEVKDNCIKEFIEQKFIEAKEKLSFSFNDEEIKHINQDDDHYKLFDEKDAKFYFRKNFKAILILASFFLNKEQCEKMISNIKGFKKTFDTSSRATRECYTYWHCKNPDSSLHTENPNGFMFLNIINDLTKFPKELSGFLDEEKIEYKLTEEKLNYIKSSVNTEEFDLIEKLKDKTFNNKSGFITELDKIKLDNEKREEVIKVGREIKIREKDKFAQYVLRYINDFGLLPGFYI